MKNKLIASFILVGLLAACKVDDEFAGPSLNDLYGSFRVLQPLDISDREVDFAAGETTFFTAEFSKNVDWEVQVKGLTSGAVKRITGFDSNLNEANALWNGTTTSLPMFRVEDCAVQLTIAGVADTLRDTLSVVSNRINEGLLLSDFENGFNPDWVPFVQSGANMTFNVVDATDAAQGNRYYDMGGTVNWDWLIGMFDIPASAYGADHFQLNSNPDNVYFNTFLFKPENISNSLVLFQFREDDDGDGVYTAGEEDMYSVQIDPSQDGWQHLYYKYADLQTLVNGAPSAAIGNGLREPDKLLQVSMLFLANPTSGYSQGYLDYMIFTENGPLIP
ncbi:MAG: hypothetical protein RLZZ77_2360 [Bacteroidota bacterium]|jgi:hypothetical protein